MAQFFSRTANTVARFTLWGFAAAAGLAMLGGYWIVRSPYLGAVWIAGIAFLMVSRIPTLSLKKIRIPHHYVMPTLLGIGLLAAFLTTAPWPTLLLVGMLYLGSIPLTVRAAAATRRTTEARRPEPAVEAPALIAAQPPAAPPGDAAVPPNEWRH